MRCILQDSCGLDDTERLVPTGYVYVLVGADGRNHFKFLVTGLELDGAGNPTAVSYRIAPIE